MGYSQSIPAFCTTGGCTQGMSWTNWRIEKNGAFFYASILVWSKHSFQSKSLFAKLMNETLPA